MVYDLNVALGLNVGPSESVAHGESSFNSKKEEVVQFEETLLDTNDHECPKDPPDIPFENVENVENVEVKVENVEVKVENEEFDEMSLHNELVKRLIKKEHKACGSGDGSHENHPSGEEINAICKVLEEKLSVGKEFPELEKVYLVYCEYARIKGFSVRKGEQRYFGKLGDIRWKIFECSCNGLPNYRSRKHRLAVYNKLVTRTDCKARLIVAREDLGPFYVALFHNEHNHGLVRFDQTYLLRSSRNLNYAKKLVLDALTSVGIGVSIACRFMEKESGGVQNVGFTRKDVYHHIERKKKLTKVEDRDVMMLVDYFSKKSNSEPYFWWKCQLDDDGRIMNFFWRDTRCAVDYDAFGDVLSVDTTFRTNKYNLVAAPFVGINHHTQNVLFGMALMSDETTNSFMWLFQTFLESMQRRQPKIIFTDQCQAMMNAIDACFPDSKHRLCQWYISRNCTTNFLKLNGDESFRRLWHKCMNLVESEDDFNTTWEEMMTNYDIKNPSWFKTMHDLRHRWSSVLTRGIFSAGLLATYRSESTNSALKSLVRADIPIIDFVCQLEQIQDTWRTRESAEDTYNIWQPGQIIRDNQLLSHAASVFTRNIYKSFEFIFTLSLNYCLDEDFLDAGNNNIEYIARDKRFPEEYRTVVFNTVSQFARCSCGYWETEGMICPHIIKVFDRRNVNVIPESLILRRWTKAAKKDIPILNQMSVGEQSSLLEYMTFASTTMRHLYDMVSAGLKHAPARKEIADRMKTLREEFEEIMSRYVVPESAEEETKKNSTAAGKKIRNLKKVEDKRFGKKTRKLQKKLQKGLKRPKREPTGKPMKKARKCDEEDKNKSKEETAGPHDEPHPLDKYFADDIFCKLSL